MLLFLLFAFAAADCETGTCMVCKNTTGCDWYGFDCYNKSSSAISTLNIPASASCNPCQAGNCTDCMDQSGCAWFKSDVPGAPGKCAVTNSSQTLYTQLDQCPLCNNYMTCNECSGANETCGWYELAGTNGKCREAAPSFAYSKVKLGFCGGDPCVNQKTCFKCQNVEFANTSICAWFSSDAPSFYDSKCGDAAGGALSDAFYNKATTCPLCAGTTCLDCKAEANCKWVAVDLGFGTSFGQCIQSSATMPTGKTEVTTCPATCDVHSCSQCKGQSACTWYTGAAPFTDDSCDLSSDSKYHIGQRAADTCPVCAADRCYECNGLSGCGWYAEVKLGLTIRQGCFSTTNFPSGRTLITNSNSKCKGVPSSSAHVAVSMVVMVVLALVA